jgi:Flp pilus assembly pilin Flp
MAAEACTERERRLMMHLIARFVTDEAGQDLPEYAILVGLVALTVVVAVVLLGDSISTTFNDIGSSMSGAGAS